MSNTCNFRTSEASTKAWFRTRGLIDRNLNIPEGMLNAFNEENTKWSKYANNKYGIEGRLFKTENNSKKAVPNLEMFYEIDIAKGIVYPENAYILEEINRQKKLYEDESGYDEVKSFKEASDFDIDQREFLNILKRRNDVAPDMFISQSRKYVMNPSKYYDLIDQDTNTVLLHNIDFKSKQLIMNFQYTEDVEILKKKKEDAIIEISKQVNDNYLDVILAVKNEDVNDYIEDIVKAKSSDEIDDVLNKLLRKVC